MPMEPYYVWDKLSRGVVFSLFVMWPVSVTHSERGAGGSPISPIVLSVSSQGAQLLPRPGLTWSVSFKG